MLLDKVKPSRDHHKYERVPINRSTNYELNVQQRRSEVHQYTYISIAAILMLVSAAAGFAASMYLNNSCNRTYTPPSDITVDGNMQPRVRLNTISRTFERNKQFEHPPPSGPGAGNISEPIWDSLIPRGLGYLSHPSIPSTSIPTVFHQLHCLYTIRRAYFALAQPESSTDDFPTADSELQRWDLGKPRSKHVAHCFDFLQQGLTCSADSTLEPAIDREHGFLGTGFQRQCRDFEALKAFAKEHRVFESEGFLAEGIDIHGVHSNG